MNTLEYLAAVKTRLRITSDYALAERLGVTRSAVSKMQQGGVSFSDDTALAVAEILQVEPWLVIADANAERAKTPEMRAKWQSLVAGFLALLSPAKLDRQERRRTPRTALSVTTA